MNPKKLAIWQKLYTVPEKAAIGYLKCDEKVFNILQLTGRLNNQGTKEHPKFLRTELEQIRKEGEEDIKK